MKKITEMNEKELIEKCLQGEEEAWTNLVNRHYADIFHHCLSIVKDESTAYDLTQETFLRGFQHLDHFRREAKFSTWLWRIGHNLSLNYLKKQHLNLEFDEDRLPGPKKEEKTDQELVLKIQLAAESLSPKLRVIFEMYDIAHVPQKEIAAQLKIPHGTVRSRLHYARKRIRSLLNH